METLGFLNKLTGNIEYKNVKGWEFQSQLDFIEAKLDNSYKFISVDGAPAESFRQFRTIKKAA